MQPGDIETELGVPIPGRILEGAEWARTAIKHLPDPGPLDWAAIFVRSAPLVLDLGCGNGRFTLGSALARPELNHFAIDVLPVVIRYATRRANQRGLHNVRFAVRDAQTFVRSYVGDGTAAEMHLYHPQPFHDPRQAHKRVLTPAFVGDVHRGLAPGGLFVVQTDNPDYWRYMTRILPYFLVFQEHEGTWPDAPEGRSRREIVARQKGLRIFRGVGTRRDDLDRAEAIELAGSLPPPSFRSHGPWIELDRWEERNR
jgi:tRNA (guanine-N7-)-methyltransferase